jgi:NADH-quinone oxidoreductase subunit L
VLGTKDIAVVIPDDTRALLREGFRFDAVQRALVVRPALALARAVKFADRDVIDFYVRGVATVAQAGGTVLRRAQTGLATAYTAWVVVAAVVVAIAGVTLS